MKKFIYATLLAGSAFALFSCNNGNYDADPNSNTNEKNPLNPNSGVTVFLGNMRADVNGTEWFFTPSDYTFLDNIYTIHGKVPKDSIFKRELSIVISQLANTGDFDFTIAYKLIDTLRLDTTLIYTSNDKSAEVKLTGMEDGNLRGTFNGTLYRSFPAADASDIINITNGEFYVPKKRL